MPVIHTFKSGKQVVIENGVRKIIKPTKVKEDAGVKTENRVINEPASGQSNYATPGRQGSQHTAAYMRASQPQASCTKPQPVAATKNRINIAGAHIGQMILGNSGGVVLNQKTEQYNAGSQNVKYNLEGCNLPQTNIGGAAIYNNKDSLINASVEKSVPDKNLTADKDSNDSNDVVEKKVLEILEKGLTAEHFAAALKKGLKIDDIHASITKLPRVTNAFVKSMLRFDAEES